MQQRSVTFQKDATATIALGVLLLWAAVLGFILIPNQYYSFGFCAVAVGLFWALQRFAPSIVERFKMAAEQRGGIAVLISLGVLLVLPVVFHDNPYWIHVFTMVFILSIAVQGLNIHLGEIGAINVGYAGFVAIGAYTGAILVADYGINFWIAIVWAILACWLFGILIGACTIRTTGDYLSLVTLGFGLVIFQLALNMSWLTHGSNGIHIAKPSILGHSFENPLSLGFITLPREANFYYVALISLVLAVAVARRMTESWVGRVWSAMRQDRIGTGCFGVNVPLLQTLSFAFGTAFAGVAGTLYAGEIGFIDPGEFTIFLSITLISMVILGGMGNWWGIVIGAMFMIIIPEKLREFQELRYFLYGLVLLVILIRRPFGMFPSRRRIHEKVLN